MRLPLEIMGYGRAERAARTKRVLELVELGGFEKKYPWQLSGGMQQRASIARALAFDADILLMDEPFGALDEIVRDRLNEELLALWARTAKTICFVTHSIPEAVFLSTRIVVMSPRPGPRDRRDREPAAAASGRCTSARAATSSRSPPASATGCAPGSATRCRRRLAPLPDRSLAAPGYCSRSLQNLEIDSRHKGLWRHSRSRPPSSSSRSSTPRWGKPAHPAISR